MEKYDDENGVWRTIRGRRVFIRDGESLGSAMARSGKFKREDIREGKREAKYNNAQKEFLKNKSEKNNRKQKNKMSNIFQSDDNKQAEKNRINENAHIEGSGQTKVQRNWNRYSEEDRREHRHELIQKKLAEYKAKKEKENDYQSRVYGSDVREADEQNKRLFGKNFKYAEEIEKENKILSKNDKELEKIKEYKAKKQSNNKSDLVGLKKEGNKYIPIRKDDEANKELKVSDLKNKSTKEIMNMKVPQTEEGKKAFNKFIAENRNEIAKELKNGDYKADSIGNYMKTISRKPKENDIILSGGKNGEDVRVGKNGKLEVLTDDDFDSNNVYVGKKQKIDDFKARRKSNNKVENVYEQDKKEGNIANRLKTIADQERYDRLYDKYKEQGMSDEKINNLLGKRPKTGLENNNKVETERELYERAKNNPESIDPMTENSVDWERLEQRFGKEARNNVESYLNKNSKQETIKNYVEKKKSNNNINYTSINKDDTFEITERSGETITMKIGNKLGNGYYAEGRAKDGGRITKLVSDEEYKKLSEIDKLYAIPFSKTKNWKKKGK